MYVQYTVKGVAYENQYWGDELLTVLTYNFWAFPLNLLSYIIQQPNKTSCYDQKKNKMNIKETWLTWHEYNA